MMNNDDERDQKYSGILSELIAGFKIRLKLLALTFVFITVVAAAVLAYLGLSISKAPLIGLFALLGFASTSLLSS